MNPIRYTGARVKRVEDPRLLRGHGRYVDDIVLPRMLHAAFVRSPHPHAAVRRIDAVAARETAGAVAVFGAAELDIAALAPRVSGGGFTPTAWPALAREPRFCGEAGGGGGAAAPDFPPPPGRRGAGGY